MAKLGTYGTRRCVQLVPCPGWPFSPCFSGVEDNLDDSDSEDYIPFLGELAGNRGSPRKNNRTEDSQSPLQAGTRSPLDGGSAETDLPHMNKGRNAHLRKLHVLPAADNSVAGSPRSLYDSSSHDFSPRPYYDSPRTSPFGKTSLYGSGAEEIIASQKLLLRYVPRCWLLLETDADPSALPQARLADEPDGQ